MRQRDTERERLRQTDIQREIETKREEVGREIETDIQRERD